MPKAVNVPADYFHCPELSRRERQYLIQKAQDSAKALVEGARSSNGPIRWIEAGIHKGVQMYKGEARNPSLSAGEQINYACGATTIPATLEDAADFFDLSTTEKVKEFASTQDDLLDGVVLYTLVAPTPENQRMHQITVKWTCISMPSVVIKDRDFLTLECQDVFTDTTGRRGWVRSYHSVKLPCCPDMQSELGFVRGSFYHTGYVFVESERPGWLDCIFSCQVNLKGNLYLPSSLHFVAMKRRIGAVADLGRLLQERRLGKQKFLSDLELVPKNQRSRCQICAVKFNMFTRKARCRKCGEVVCHQCSQVWDINVPKYGLKKVRVCSKCSMSTDREALENMSLNSERQSISMASEQQPPMPSSQSISESMASEPRLHHHNQHHPPAPVRSLQHEQHPQQQAPAYGRPPPPPRPEAAGVYEAPRDYRRGPPSAHDEPYRQRSFISGEGDYGYGHHPHQQHPPLPHRDGSRDGSTGYYPEDDYAPGGYGRDPRYGRPPSHQQPADPYYSHPAERSPQPPPPYHHNAPAGYYNHRERPPSRGTKEHLPHHRRTEETASTSSEFSASRGVDEPSLTAKALEEHTRMMGRPGPVARSGYAHPSPPPGPYHAPPPPPPAYYAGQYAPPTTGGIYGNYNGRGDHHHPSGWAPSPSHPVAHGRERRSSYGTDYDALLHREYHDGYQLPPQPPAPYDRRSPPPRPRSVQGPNNRHLEAPAATATASRQSETYVVRTPSPAKPTPEVTTATTTTTATTATSGATVTAPGPPRPSVGLSFGSDQRQLRQHDGASEIDEEEAADRFDAESMYSPTGKAIADDFSTLISQEAAARETVDSYRFSVSSSLLDQGLSFCDTLNDYSAQAEPESEGDVFEERHSLDSEDDDTLVLPNTTVATANATTSNAESRPPQEKPAASETKDSIVQLYQQILELTKRQHALDAKPDADADAKDEVAKNLQALYQRLNRLTLSSEVEV